MDEINLDIECLKQRESLRVAQIDHNNEKDAKWCEEAEIEDARASISTLQSSIDAKKAELERLIQASRLEDAKETEFQRSMDDSLARNVVLEDGN